MTATIQPPRREDKTRPRRMRFSSLESLGFSDSAATWSDNPVYAEIMPRGRHEPSPPEPDTLADWEPQDFGRRLEGRNFRWSLLLVSLLTVAALTAGGYWLYQQPTLVADAAVANATSAAETLDRDLGDLQTYNSSLALGTAADADLLFDVDRAARALFDASGEIVDNQSRIRSATAGAASAALDGVRLAGDTGAYVVAVSPLLLTPELETDPNLIELDDAARAFGAWQLSFDETRTALPDGVMSDVTEELDVLSGDLSTLLSDYVDALREDDAQATEAVVVELDSRLGNLTESLSDSISAIQARISERISEARNALAGVLGP